MQMGLLLPTIILGGWGMRAAAVKRGTWLNTQQLSPARERGHHCCLGARSSARNP
jgi:hypothetical protein